MKKIRKTKIWREWTMGSILLIMSLTVISCELNKEQSEPPIVEKVVPVNINEDGFEFLDKMQGQWIGTNSVVGMDFDWFAFDYRAISPSHVFGIFEGGSMGNLFTSFFVTDFKDTRTIMARNGGVLNGIYRTSYFVLDSVSHANDSDYYRFVDAIGGKDVMWMSLKFSGDDLSFYSYTSRLGLSKPPTRHMTFEGTKFTTHLSDAAAALVEFPKNEIAWDFSNGFREDWLYRNEGDTVAQSASFLSYGEELTISELALWSGDPVTIDDHPTLSKLNVKVVRNETIAGKRLFLNLSSVPLTDEYGYLTSDMEAYNSIILFPELDGTTDEFIVTYLHPGDYYVSIIADVNDDGFISSGDFSHVNQPITIAPESDHEIEIDNIIVENTF